MREGLQAQLIKELVAESNEALDQFDQEIEEAYGLFDFPAPPSDHSLEQGPKPADASRPPPPTGASESAIRVDVQQLDGSRSECLE